MTPVGQVDLFREPDAVFSPDRIHRYQLSRVWDPHGAVCNFVMLNPSTADEKQNDPTVTRCERFAIAWGFGALVVTNLFGFRATNPLDLRTVGDKAIRIGSENDEHIREVAKRAGMVICAWGEHGALDDRASHVIDILRVARAGRFLHCLSRNKGGEPVHPLYQPNGAKPVVFEEVPA